MSTLLAEIFIPGEAQKRDHINKYGFFFATKPAIKRTPKAHSFYFGFALGGVFLLLSAEANQAAERPPRAGREFVAQDLSSNPVHKKKAASKFTQGSFRPSHRGKQKKATELIWHQEPPRVVPRVLDQAGKKNVSLQISLLRQRIYLKVGEEIAVDSPISSGKVAGTTPKGRFTILEKDADHRSSVYGNFVDKDGEIIRAGVSLKIDSAPSGTSYVGASMKWFMRLTWAGVGMHAGILPGYPASHGCIRLPEPIAKILYDHVSIGTPVIVSD